MRNQPDTEDVNLKECYHDVGQREFERIGGPEWLRKSLSHCHDVNRKLIKADGEKQAKILKLQANLSNCKLMLWIACTACAALWGVTLVFGDKLLACLMR